MSINDIQSWIKQSKKNGVADKQIEEELKNSGWTTEQINQVLMVDKQAQTKETVKISKRHDDLASSQQKAKILGYLAGLIIIGIIVFFIGSYYGSKNDNTNSNANYLTNSVSLTSTTTDSTSINSQLADQSTIKKFDDYDELKQFLENNAASSSSGYYGTSVSRMIFDEVFDGETFGLGASELSLPTPTGMKSSEAPTWDYSTTNIQVEGVDESDIIKTDGKYIYASSKNNVHIIEAYPAGDSKILSTINFESTPQNIYINGNYLMVYGLENNIYSKPYYESIRPYSSYTFLHVYNLTDKENPQLVRDLEFEGSYVNSRMIGDYVYFVTSQPASYSDDDEIIPYVAENNEILPTQTGTPRCNCPDVYYIDAPYNYYVYTSITAINMADNTEAISNEVYLLSSGENMYVSPTNIYLVYTKYVSEHQLTYNLTKELLWSDMSKKDKNKIQEIEATPNYILSADEKIVKIYQILSKYLDRMNTEQEEIFQNNLQTKVNQVYTDISKELEKTVIHKIAINKNKLIYQGSGEVTGHVLNQFSMDEHQDYFRIATTKSQTWTSIDFEQETESYSNVYVLDSDLKIVGSVEKLAMGEQIYSARFMQNRVYLVTFRQMDPLFAIDLTDPKNPLVLGELKIPGFSSYLHPYDETKLIGFGKQATNEGIVQGLKLSLFDVSDVNNLKEIDTFEMGDRGSDSIALSDHKAFLFSKDKNLLVIPVTLNEYLDEEDYLSKYTHGAMVFTVTPDGFEFQKRIDHSDGSDDDSNTNYYYGYYYYDTSVKRSLYIDDALYTLSNKYLKMNLLEDLTEIKTLNLSSDNI